MWKWLPFNKQMYGKEDMRHEQALVATVKPASPARPAPVHSTEWRSPVQREDIGSDMTSHRGENAPKQPMRALERRHELALTQISHTDTHSREERRPAASCRRWTQPQGFDCFCRLVFARMHSLTIDLFHIEWSITQHRWKRNVVWLFKRSNWQMTDNRDRKGELRPLFQHY